MARKGGLGRGLGSLIPTGPPPRDPATEAVSEPADLAARQPTGVGADASGARPAASASPADAGVVDPQSIADAPDASNRSVGGYPAVHGAYFAEIPIAAIRPNPKQPRQVFDEEALEELAASIREFGVLQPIVVRPLEADEATHGIGYELVMGERRLRAATEVGLTGISAIVRQTDDAAMLRDALLENLHRSQLNPLEEAAAYHQLLGDFACTHEELAQRIGRSRPQISNTIRLLKLPIPVQQRVAAGVLSAGHARAILSLEDADSMQRLSDKIVNEDLSVRAAEAAAKAPESGPTRARPQAGARRAHLDEVAERLGDRLSTRVKISLTARKGQIIVDFASIQDLNRILEEIGESGYSQL